MKYYYYIIDDEDDENKNDVVELEFKDDNDEELSISVFNEFFFVFFDGLLKNCKVSRLPDGYLLSLKKS